MSKPKDVYWLVAPLAIYKDVGLAKLSKAVKGDKPEHYRFLTWAQHWAIQVDENCYEFSATEGKKLDIKGTGKLRLRVVAKNAWWKIRNEWNVHVDTHKVGQTLKSVKQLEDAGTASLHSPFSIPSAYCWRKRCFITVSLTYLSFSGKDLERVRREQIPLPRAQLPELRTFVSRCH